MRTPPFIIQGAGLEIQTNSSQRISLGFLLEIVRIGAINQEIQSPCVLQVILIPSSTIFSVLTLRYTRHICNSIWDIRIGKHRYPCCDIHNWRQRPHFGILHCYYKHNKISPGISGRWELQIRFIRKSIRRRPHTRYQHYAMLKSYLYLRLYHLQSFIR